MSGSATSGQVVLRVIIGLPGSGKSALARALVAELDVACFDDFHAGGDGSPRGAPSFPALVDSLRCGRASLVADIAFCDASRLDAFLTAVREEVPEVDPELTYFAKDIGQCLNNVNARDAASGRSSLPDDMATIGFFSKVYAPPQDARPVYRPGTT